MSTKLTPGRYRAKILYHTMNVNTVGNPELRIAVLPNGGIDNQPLPPNYTPTPITIFLTITPATMEMPQTPEDRLAGKVPQPGWVLQTLKHLGFLSVDLTTLDPASDCAHVFTGREIVILGTEDEYKGKKRTRWNIVRTGTENKPVESTALSALSTRYARVLTNIVPAQPAQQPKTPF